MLKIRHAALFATLIVSMCFCSYASAQQPQLTLKFNPLKNVYVQGQGPDISMTLPNSIQGRLAIAVYRQRGFGLPAKLVHSTETPPGTTVKTISLTDTTGVVGREYFAVGFIWDTRNGKAKWTDVATSHIYEFVQGGGEDMDPNEVSGLSGVTVHGSNSCSDRLILS